MSLTVAVVASIGAAAAYGGASATQFSRAHAQTQGEHTSLRGVVALLKDPHWLLGTGGDVVGLVLQVIALDHGPVSLVQPLQVLGLLVALPVAALFDGRPVVRRALLAALVLVAGLGGFLGLVGNPGRGTSPARGDSLALTFAALVPSLLLCALVRRRSGVVRAVTHGLVSGVLFAVVAVLARTVLLRYGDSGWSVFAHARGLVPLACVVVVGLIALGLVQAGFQLGPLAASLPAQTAAEPVASVALGQAILGEGVSFGAGHVIGYAATLLVVVGATRALALAEAPVCEPVPGDPVSVDGAPAEAP